MAGARLEGLSENDPAALGAYRLLGRLASGGMGRIYLARAADGQLVAVKTLLAEGEVSAIDRRRFAREVKVAQRIDSAFTARVREADPDAEMPWMAIDYIAAPSLSELVSTGGVLPASAVQWLAAGTAEALVALHGEGIVHRDVKPQNILLPLAGPRLIDFGISHAADITRTSLTLGTIAFTSPEQARGDASTSASDVYSLGATLFHLAMNRPPYRVDGDTLALLARVQRGELDLTGLPKEIAPLIRPCLAADPAERPRPADMLSWFRKSLAGLPVSRSGSRWLPQRWTELIEVYERQGRDLERTVQVDPGAPTVDQRTSVTPPPGPTRVYTQTHDDAARAARQQELRDRERERAASEHARAEAARQERRAARERAARMAAEEKKRAEREQAEKERAERERAQARARASSSEASSAQSSARTPPRPPRTAAGAAATPPPAPTPTPTPTPAKKKSSDGWMIIPLLIVGLFLWNSCESDTGSSGRTSSGSTSTSTSTGGSQYTPPPSPTPDASDVAFRSVSSGDCINAYDDGYDAWSTRTPETVDCDAANAYLLVTSAYRGIAITDCPTDIGAWYWYHAGSQSAFSTTLCVSRQFRKGECFVAKADGDKMTKARLMTVWDCGKDTVPNGYNRILQITDLYRSQKSYGNGFCSQSRYDQERYWIYTVHAGKTALCTMAVD